MKHPTLNQINLILSSIFPGVTLNVLIFITLHFSFIELFITLMLHIVEYFDIHPYGKYVSFNDIKHLLWQNQKNKEKNGKS
jgi:hypothetical protein